MPNLALYFLAIFSLSQASNLVRLASAPADVIGFWRLMAAALILVPFAITKGDLKNLFKNKTGLLATIGSGFFLYLHLYTYFYSVQNTSIANCMILFATNPIFAAAGSYFFFNEKFTLKLGIAYILAFTGVFYLVSANLVVDPSKFAGNISAIVSALLYSIYVLLGKKARHSVSNFTYSFSIYLIAGICFGVAGFSKQINMTTYPFSTWLAIAATVALPTLLGHFLLGYLLKHMNVNLMTCGKLIEPVLSSMTALLLFQEQIRMQSFVAFGFTSASVLILFFPWQIFFKKGPNL